LLYFAFETIERRKGIVRKVATKVDRGLVIFNLSFQNQEVGQHYEMFTMQKKSHPLGGFVYCVLILYGPCILQNGAIFIAM
jgi:hypothetical protein